MPSGNLAAAVQQAINICWNESIGYNMGGMAHSSAEGVDCSGLVGRVLSDNGFNYPSYHVGTINMGAALRTAGFIELQYTGSSFHPEPGDIFVMNHLDMSGGHTFIYMENIKAYTDYNADSPNTGIVSKVKVEASSTRGHTAAGDHRKNGTGAYWEVWVHAYWQLVTGYDWTDPGDSVKVYRWPGGLNQYDSFPVMAGLLLYRRKRGIN